MSTPNRIAFNVRQITKKYVGKTLPNISDELNGDISRMAAELEYWDAQLPGLVKPQPAPTGLIDQIRHLKSLLASAGVQLQLSKWAKNCPNLMSKIEEVTEIQETKPAVIKADPEVQALLKDVRDYGILLLNGCNPIQSAPGVEPSQSIVANYRIKNLAEALKNINLYLVRVTK